MLYSRKLTEHCKPAIREKIKIIKKKKKKERKRTNIRHQAANTRKIEYSMFEDFRFDGLDSTLITDNIHLFASSSFLCLEFLFF